MRNLLNLIENRRMTVFGLLLGNDKIENLIEGKLELKRRRGWILCANERRSK